MIEVYQKIKDILYNAVEQSESEYYGFSGIPEDSLYDTLKQIMEVVNSYRDNETSKNNL